MKSKLGLFFLAGCMVLSAQGLKAQQYAFDKKIPLPGDAGWDYLAVDEVNQRLYVSHGNAFNVVDLATDEPVGVISGLEGVHGIAIVNSVNKGFISDSRAKAVVVVDLSTLKVLKKISLTAEDEDGIIYDPASDKVLVFNGDSKSACAIDVHTLELAKTIDLQGKPEFAAADGKGLVFNNLEDINELAVIDTKTMALKAKYPLSPCGSPTGLAYDAVHQRAFTGCRGNKGLSIVDGVSGKVIQTLPIGAGVDAVAYDEATGLVFASCGDGTTTIIHQDSPDNYSVVQTLSTHVRARTMALDKKTKKIYLSAAEPVAGTRTPAPGSFAVYVYKPA